MTATRQIVDFIRPFRNCVIAFSGGVDSAVVAKAARLALGADNCLALTAISPSVSQHEKEIAKNVAVEIGIQHRFIPTQEIDDPDYVANTGQRCFHCKSELYSKLNSVLTQSDSDAIILNGTNHDDLGDYRPGLRAADEFKVRSPLAELKFSKAIVRQMARDWGISIWNKPASPCLASRIAYGESVTPEKLGMVEAAETCLRELGFGEFRVRLHPGKLARIEVHPTEIEQLVRPAVRNLLNDQLKAIGFQTITIDLEGFRSGNLNESIQTVQIRQGSSRP